jgi:hypothetical protein
MPSEEDDHSNKGSGPFHFCECWSTEIDKILGEDEAPLFFAESATQAFVPVQAIVDMSNLTTTKIIDKRLGKSGDVQYKCDLMALWMSGQLVEETKKGRDRIQSYENRIKQERRLGTLRKREHSQI